MDKTIITAVVIAATSFILQKTLSNLLYGIIIFIIRPFRKGDTILIQQASRDIASGKVIKKSLLYIYIKTYERDVVIVPNSLLESCVITNRDYKDNVNYIDYIKITFDSNLSKIQQKVEDVVTNHKETLNTKDNTHIILKTSDGGLIVEYNVRTENIEKSFDVCSDVKEKIIVKIQQTHGIHLG